MFESRRPDTFNPAHDAAAPRLVSGDLRADGASLVAFAALRRAGAEPLLDIIAADAPDRAARIAAVSPTSRLPVLVEHGTTIWEPLAVLEWAAERAPSLWPAHARRRAVARSVVAELHGGFTALRAQLPFDWFARYRLATELPAAVQVDVHRLAQLWAELLEDGDGFLFGPRPGLADLAMVPMAARLRSYDVWPREPAAAAYGERVLNLAEIVQAFADSEPAPTLAPPALAAPASAAAASAPDTHAAGVAVPPPDDGPRKLEDVVARARQRERAVDGGRARAIFQRAPPTAPPASAEPPVPRDPPRPEPPAPEPAPPAGTRRHRGEPPGGGRRRRPPGRS